MKDPYTRKERLSREALNALARENGVGSIRVGFTDLLGIQRGKMLPADSLGSLLRDTEDNPEQSEETAQQIGSAAGGRTSRNAAGISRISLGCSSAVMALCYDDEFAPSSLLPDRRDDMDIVPDPSTAMALPCSPGTLFMHSDLYYGGRPLAVDPRGFLKGVVDRYHARGLEPMAACELEFFAFRRDAAGRRVPYVEANCNCYTVSRKDDPLGLIGRIADALSAMDFGYRGWNHEFFSGQYEFNWDYSAAVDAADRGALFKAICKDLAFDAGAEVTFMARPAGAPGGSGCHFHLSLTDMRTGKNACADPEDADGLSALARAFAGGILSHARAIAPFLAPTVNCYKRYLPDSYAPTHVAWGDDNRTVYLRVPKQRGAGTRLEVRAASAACNPYLALGALLLAGLDGIERGTEPGPMVAENVYQDTAVRGGLPALPSRLSEALNVLRGDAWARANFPPELLKLFLSMKERECLGFERAVTDWEMDTYFQQM